MSYIANAGGGAGAQGDPGPQGPAGSPGLDAEEPELPYIIPGPTGAKGDTGAPGGGGGSWTVVEQNLGGVGTESWRGNFTLVDAAITPSSKVAIMHAPGPYTGKGTRADEAEMDPLWCVAEPGSGQATVYWRTHAQVISTFSDIRGNQPISTGTDQGVQPSFQAALIQRVVGRVRGNVKFMYQVGA